MRRETLQTLKLPNHSVMLMAELLRELHRDPLAAATVAGVPVAAFDDPHFEITGAQELAYQRVFFRATQARPDLWIELGRRYRILTHGHLAFALAMSTAANLRQMFEISRCFGDLHYSLAGISLSHERNQLTGFRSTLDEVPEDLRDFTMLRDLASGASIFRDVWGRDFPFRRVETALSPGYRKLVSALIGKLPITFGAQGNAWFWSEPLDDAPLVQSDAHLHNHFLSSCAELMSAARKHRDIEQALAAVFGERGPRVSLGLAADDLGMSVRTLQRRLHERDLSFREAGNRWLVARATELMREARNTISSIAWELGYLDGASFTRAFRAVTGTSPGAYRRELRLRNQQSVTGSQ